MVNSKSLKNLKRVSGEEARIQGAKGPEAKKRKRRGRELVRAILELGVIDDEQREELRRAGLGDGDIVNEALADYAMIKRASRGDAQAYAAIMKKAGYMTEQHDVKLAEKISVKFGG